MTERYNYSDFKLKIENIFNTYGNKTAIVKICNNNNRIEYSFNEILRSAKNLKNRLFAMGLKDSDRIAVISEYSCRVTICNISLAYDGFTSVLLDASLPRDELNRLI